MINGTTKLNIMLSLIFRAMIIHGYSPDALLLGTMTPIPKGPKHQTSDNYRAITLISCILKLLDYLILRNQKKIFKTDPLQFGFKENSSTTLCSSFFMEVSRYFVANKTEVHAVLLDATKAFDRVEYTLLFNRLLDKGMNSLYVRCLLYMYQNQRLRIKWNKVFSNEFKITNGVKQGGVLLPLLFGIYVDHLIERLRESGLGCTVGPHFAGCVVYADDIVLLSPTITGMEEMLKISLDFSEKFHMKFNASKSQYIIFSPKGNSRKTNGIFVGNRLIHSQSKVTHLGHIIYADLNSCDLEGVTGAFYKQFNLFMRKFGHVPSAIKAKLFNTHCASFYGGSLIPLAKVGKLQVLYRKALRQVFGLSYRTHCKILSCMPFCSCHEHMFLLRFAKFAASALQHEYAIVRHIFHRATSHKYSAFGLNISHMCSKLMVNQTDVLNMPWTELRLLIKKNCKMNCHRQDNVVSSNIVFELCQARDGLYVCPLEDNQINYTSAYVPIVCSSSPLTVAPHVILWTECITDIHPTQDFIPQVIAFTELAASEIFS